MGFRGRHIFGHPRTSFGFRFWPKAPAVAQIANEMGITHRLTAEGDFGHLGLSDESLDGCDEVGVMLGHARLDNVGMVLPSTDLSRTRPSMAFASPLWEASHMETALQRFLRLAVEMGGSARDHYDKEIQKLADSKGKALYDIGRGKSSNPNTKTLLAISAVLDQPMDLLQRAVAGEQVDPISTGKGPVRPLDIKRAPEQMPTRGAHDDVGAVKLRRLNLELAMGVGTDIEDWIEEQEVSFDANLFHAITSSDTDRVFIGSGIGDSMTPTIGDRDDVLIDLNENELKRGDRIYAITIEGAGAVKRLMPAGNGMVEVISDNVNHAARVRLLPRQMVKIIGRVIWSGRRH